MNQRATPVRSRLLALAFPLRPAAQGYGGQAHLRRSSFAHCPLPIARRFTFAIVPRDSPCTGLPTGAPPAASC